MLHAFDLVGMEIGGGMLIGWIGATAGILIPYAGGDGRVDGRVSSSIMGTVCSHDISSSSVHSSNVVVTSSTCCSPALFDMAAVSSLAGSSSSKAEK